MVQNNETLNQEETAETQKKKEVNLGNLIGQYIEKGLDGNLTFFKGVKNVQDDFYTYLLKSGDKELLEELKTQKTSDEISLELTETLRAKTIPIYHTLQQVEDRFFSELDLDNNQSAKFKKVLPTTTITELQALLKSQKQRNKFVLKHGVLTKDELDKKLDGINQSEQKVLNDIFGSGNTIINTLSLEENQDILDSIFRISHANMSVDEQDIKGVLESEIFSDEQKKQLVEYFLPFVSVKFAQEHLGVNENDIKKLLNQDQTYQSLSQEEKNKIYSKINTSEIFVPTKNFQLSSLSEAIYKSIADEINDAKIETVDIFGFDAFKLECKRNNIPVNLEKCKEGNFFTIEYPKNEAGDKEKQYFYIKNIGSMSVEFVNVTKRNGISASIDNPKNVQGKKEVKTYQEFFNDLKNLSNRSEYALQFAEFSDFKDTQGEEIQKVPEKESLETVDQLTKALNEIDPKGYSGDIKNMAFRFKKGNADTHPFGENFHMIADAGTDFIKLDTGEVFGGPNSGGKTLQSFFETFESKQCTRFKKIDSAKDLFTQLASESEIFKGFEYDHGKMVAEEHHGDHHAPGVNLFVGENQEIDGSIVIDEIEDGKISVTLGTYKEGGKDKPGEFKGEKSGKDMTYTEFYMLIKSRKLKAKKEPYESHDHDHEHHGEHMHEHRSLFTLWMDRCWSIAELSAGAHQLIHAVEHSLETGNKLKAAKAALAMGRFLPTHLRVELQSEVEKSEKETMEKIKGEMLGVDWKDMWPMVEHVLENKSAPQYEVEAAMFAVMKYGSLYPKELAPYRGQFIWFKKLGGHPSMIPILTQKALENDPDLVVTEEVLINALLAMQAKGVPGYLPKRRSKIHKEFGKTIVEGVNNEMGDGEREAGVRMTADGRIDYLMQEFKGSTLAHGVGGMEKVWDKGPDPAWKMNTLPFVIMTSGVSLNMHQKLINQLKSYAFTTPYGSLMFVASKSGVEFYQNYVRKVIELRYGANSDMLKAYNGIQHPGKKTSQEVAYTFWKKYGSELYPIINMNDGFVLSQKDKPENKVLSEYYNKMKGLYTGKDFSVKREHITGGHYDASNSPIIQTGALIDDYVYAKDRGYLDDTSKTVIESGLDYLKNIVHNTAIDETARKKLFKKEYSVLERKIFSLILPYTTDPEQYSKFPIYSVLKENGFDLYNKQLQDKNNPQERDAFYKNGYENFLEKQFYDIKNRNHTSQDDIFAEKNLVQHSIDSIIHNDSAINDKQMQQRA